MSQSAPLFVIDNDPIVPWPVTVSLPVAGGSISEFRFTAQVRVLPPEEHDKLVADINPEQPMPAVLKRNAEIFERLIVGWEDIKGTDGAVVPFTTGLLAAQINGPRGPALSVGLWRAINEVRFGVRSADVPGAASGN